MKKSTKEKSEKLRAGGTWSEARFWSFVRSNLRRAQWPVIYQVKKNASRPYQGPNSRQKFEYECSSCKGWFKGTDVQVDHIVPCGSLKSYEDLPRFVKTLYCEADNLRVLCTECHQGVTNNARQNQSDDDT